MNILVHIITIPEELHKEINHQTLFEVNTLIYKITDVCFLKSLKIKDRNLFLSKVNHWRGK